MKVILHKPDDFSASVILRTLYYSTYFENVEVYISGKVRRDRIVRYSRVPVYEVKNKVYWTFPIVEDAYIVDPRSKTKVFEVVQPEALIIDFSKDFYHKYKGVSCLGIKNLAYEAVSVLYYLFIRELKEEIPYLKNVQDRHSIYLGKRFLDFVEEVYPNPRKLLYILQHIFKKYRLVLGLKKYKIEGDFRSFKVHYNFEVFDSKLRKTGECYALFYNNVLKVPVYNGREIEYREFYIDNRRKRVYITKKFYIEKEKEDPLKSFSILF